MDTTSLNTGMIPKVARRTNTSRLRTRREERRKDIAFDEKVLWIDQKRFWSEETTVAFWNSLSDDKKELIEAGAKPHWYYPEVLKFFVKRTKALEMAMQGHLHKKWGVEWLGTRHYWTVPKMWR